MVFERSSRSLQNVLNNRVRGEINDITHPALRFGANKLLDQVLGNPSYKNNDFEQLLANNIKQLDAERTLFSEPASITSSGTVVSEKKDWRARLRPKAGGAEKFYSATGNDWLMKPIQESGGMVWQYVPAVTLTSTVEYHQTHTQGQNYPIRTYNLSTPTDIPISSDFTANDLDEARYLLAIMTFLKVATKGYFGDAAVVSGDYGTPPPVLLFEYLGDYGFNKIPVVVQSYLLQLPEDVDYVPVKFEDTVTYVPTKVTLSVILLPTYTPHRLRRDFNINDIASGKLYRQGYI